MQSYFLNIPFFRWWQGSNVKVPKINLDPSKRPKEVLTVFQGPVADRDPRKTVQQNGHSTTTNIAQNGQNGQNGTVSFLCHL